MPVSGDKIIKGGRKDLPKKANGKKWYSHCGYEGEISCEVVTRVFAMGGTKSMAAAALLVSATTIAKWRKDFPEFDEAWLAGLAASEAWWDKKGIANLEWISHKGEKMFRSEIWKFVKQAEFGASGGKSDIVILNGQPQDDEKLASLIKDIKERDKEKEKDDASS